MSKTWAKLTAAALTALFAAGALAQSKSDKELLKEYEGVPWEKAHVIESQHYTVKCNSTEKVARRYSKLMEKLLKLYSETFPNLYTKKMKWEVYIYKTRREFHKKHPGMSAYTAGFYWPPDKRIYTYHGLFGVSGSTFTLLAHEGIHAFQHSFLKSYYSAPAWLLEGMAVVFEGIEVGKDGQLLLEKPSRDRIVQVKVELKERSALKLSEVVGENAKRFARNMYAYAGLFVWWLAKTKPERRKVLDELLTQLSTRDYEKNDLERLLRSHLGKNLAAVEKEWVRWVKKQKVAYTGRKVSGGVYTSQLLGFTIKRPGPHWVMEAHEKLRDGRCASFKRSGTGGVIGVTVYVNQLPLSAVELYLQILSNLQDTADNTTVEQKERPELKGYPGFRITYTAKSTDSKDADEKDRVQLVGIVTPRRIYLLRFQCPQDKWTDNHPDFVRALERFKLLK